MGRVVNSNNPGKLRNQYMRTAAELLRLLSQKTQVDDEAKDMAAQLLYALRGIEDGIEASAIAWEKRDYWIKAEQLRQRWGWAGNAGARLENLIRKAAWDSLPALMADLFEHFAEIKITKLTRPASEWQGAYQRLREELNC